MKYTRVYSALIDAVKNGALKEPFGQSEFKVACPGFADGTYRAFLWKHSGGGQDAADDAVLLERIAPGKFKLIRPFTHDF